MQHLSNVTIYDAMLQGSSIIATPGTLEVSPIALKLNPSFLYIGNKQYTIQELEQRIALLDRLLRDHYPEEFI